MNIFSVRALLPFVLLVSACAGDPAPPPSTPSTGGEPSVTVPPPPPPPLPLARTDALYIIGIPTHARPAAAVVCTNDADCNALLPPDPPMIVRKFADENWVLVTLPAGYAASSVSSDGAMVTAKLEVQCPGGVKQTPEPKLVIYRVAKSVTRATVDVSAPTPICPKVP